MLQEFNQRETDEHAAVPAEAPPPPPPPPTLPASDLEVEPWHKKKDGMSGKYFYYKKNRMFATGW